MPWRATLRRTRSPGATRVQRRNCEEMNMKSLSKFPFWAYYAVLSFYFYYSWSTRTGLYPFIMQIDKDSIEITALVLIVVAIMLPAVVMKYVFGWDRPTTPLEEAPRLTAMV